MSQPGTQDPDEIRREFGLTLDWDDPDAEDDLLADPELQAIMAEGLTPQERQQRFERQIRGIYDRAADLPAALERIEASAGDKLLEVTVGGNGTLRAISFRPSARGAEAAELNRSFATCYATATQEAATALTAELGAFQAESGVERDGADDLEALFDKTLADADATLTRLQSDEHR